MKNNYGLQNLLEDIARGAEVDRAAKWLEVAADDYPAIFGIIRENLNRPPGDVLTMLLGRYPVFGLAIVGLGCEKIELFIQRLQTFYKEREAK